MKAVIDQAIMDAIDRADAAFLLLLWQRPLESIPHYCELTKKRSDASQANLVDQHLTEIYGEGDCGLLHHAILKFQSIHPDIHSLEGDYIAEFIIYLKAAFIKARKILHQALVDQIALMTSYYHRDQEEPLLLEEDKSLSLKEQLQRRDNRHIAIGIAQQQCDVVIQEAFESCIQKVNTVSKEASITLEALSQYRAEKEAFATKSYLDGIHALQELDQTRQDIYLIPDGQRGEERGRLIREWISQVAGAPSDISKCYQALFDAATKVCLEEALEKEISDKQYGLTMLSDPKIMGEVTEAAKAKVTPSEISKKLQYALEGHSIWSHTRFGVNQETIFHLISKAGHHTLLANLCSLVRHINLEEPDFLDLQDKQGNTVFHAAMGCDQYQCAITLVGFDINLMLCNTAGVKAYHACDSQGNGLAHYAVASNNFDWMSIISAIQAQPDDQSILTVLDHILMQTNFMGDTALHIARRNSNFEAACVLLSYGADPRIVNHSGEVPFKMLNNAGDTYAIEAYRRNEKGLIDQFYDTCPECITALNREGHTLLGLCLEQGDYKYAMHLIRRCNANFFDMHAIAHIPVYQLRNAHDGATLLHYLVRKGAHTDAFYLIDQGVDPSVEDSDGQPVYKAQDPDGLPLTHCAIKYKSYTSFVRLINAGVVNPDDVNRDGDTLWTMLLNLVEEEEKWGEEHQQQGVQQQDIHEHEEGQKQKVGQQAVSYKYLDFQKFITLIMVNYYEAQRRYNQEITESEGIHDVEYLLEPQSPFSFGHLEPPEIHFTARPAERVPVLSTNETSRSPIDDITAYIGRGQRVWSHLQQDAISELGDISEVAIRKNLRTWDRIRHGLVTRDQCKKFLENKRAFLKCIMGEACISTIVSHMGANDLDLSKRLQTFSLEKDKNMPLALLQKARQLYYNATHIPGYGFGVDYL